MERRLHESFASVFLCLFLFFLLIACDSGSTGPSGDSIRLEPAEKNQFDKLNLILEEAVTLYPPFEVAMHTPSYVILDESLGGEKRGFFMDPAGKIQNESTTIRDAENYLFTLFRNDDFIDEAELALGEFGRFSFDFQVGDQNHFLIHDVTIDHFYDDYKNRDQNWLPLIYTHELFHTYQFDHWVIPPPHNLTHFDYPRTSEQFTLLLYLYDLMTDAHHIKSYDEANEYLKKYVVIREQQINTDPSGNEVIKKLSNFWEMIEGSARYVEAFSAGRSIYPSIHNDPTHGWRSFMENATDATDITSALLFRTWYHTGAAACHLLNLSGVNIDQGFRLGKSPLQLVQESLSLSEEEREQTYQEIVQSPAWTIYESRAQELLEITGQKN